MKEIVIKGARQHNLKNIDVRLPRDALVVISGPSGSGKSSLAFDTIFAEGQRRFVESLSAYVRQFLGRLEKPKVDYIEGLSPAISIEQKTTNRNPRSTVGTITEISDYYRLLFARIGLPHDPISGKKIEKQTVDEIVSSILSHPQNSRCMIFSPVVRNRKGKHSKVLESARKAGFSSVRIDDELYSLDDEIDLDKNKKHTIQVLVDRVIIHPDRRKRIVEAVEAALGLSEGMLFTLLLQEGGDSIAQAYSLQYAYPDSDLSFPALEPTLFSFNSPYGACPICHGIGVIREFDPLLIAPDQAKSFNDGAFIPYNPENNWGRYKFEAIAPVYGFDLDTPLAEIPETVLEKIFYGDPRTPVNFHYQGGKFSYQTEEAFNGIIKDLQRRYKQTPSSGIRQWLERFMREQVCSACQGKRLRPEALAVYLNQVNIHEISAMSVKDAVEFFSNLQLSKTEASIAKEILKEIRDRLSFLVNVGLDYLSLDRGAATLSGGESQRIRLASQLGSSLVGVLYVLDEPTIGLHQRDNERLLTTLRQLCDMGNTLLIVEHDEQTLRQADYILDLGPAAGVHGGEVVASGTPEEICKNENSLTGLFLSGRRGFSLPEKRRVVGEKWLSVKGVSKHNLKNVDLQIPLGSFVTITGVSGSGKSTLICDVLLAALEEKLKKKPTLAKRYFTEVEGYGELEKVLLIDQTPIGRTPRSNPATYVGAFQHIRELLSRSPEARARGYLPGRFSFNVKSGRCEACQGAGVIQIDMQFLSNVYITCDICKGKRYTLETLDITFKGLNIHDILELTVEEAMEVFSAQPKILSKMQTLFSVGLGYIKLGQSALTLSGGEAQRVKLSLELSKRSTGKTLCIMDEPTTGLHFEDTHKLLSVINSLVDKGNTVVVIEHNLDVIVQADHIVDLGPEGGERGGRIVASGTPEEISVDQKSITGRYVYESLQR